jgi:AGCS family alanine or glycine:cation symporter
MLFLLKTFLGLLKDYKARYMGIGEVDPEFVLWYEDKKKLAAK